MLNINKVLAGVLDNINTCEGDPSTVGNCAPPGANDVMTLISNVINIGLGLIGTISLIVLIYGGILYMGAGGNPDQINKAKNVIFYAIIGLVLSISSWAIITFVTRAF